MGENTIAIITARGGSKRIPRKNTKEFCGKPIIYYSIKAALEAGIFDEVMVSTEDEEIANIAKELGASVPFLRSQENANDFSTTADVLLETIEEYQKRGKQYNKLCCIYPTAPFITAKKLKAGIKLLDNADSVMPVVPFSFPPQRCVIIEEEKIKMKWPQYEKSRSQDLEKYYHDCGQFYCIKVEALLKNKSLFTDNMAPLIMDEREVQDIDTIADWEIAELKYKRMLEKKA